MKRKSQTVKKIFIVLMSVMILQICFFNKIYADDYIATAIFNVVVEPGFDYTKPIYIGVTSDATEGNEEFYKLNIEKSNNIAKNVLINNKETVTRMYVDGDIENKEWIVDIDEKALITQSSDEQKIYHVTVKKAPDNTEEVQKEKETKEQEQSFDILKVIVFGVFVLFIGVIIYLGYLFRKYRKKE